MTSNSDSYILISKNIDKFDYFHPKTLFNTLTNDHIIKILLLQKMRLKGNIKNKVFIYLDNLNLDDFRLNEKVLNILVDHEKYLIYFENTDSIDKGKIQKYFDYIEKFKK